MKLPSLLLLAILLAAACSGQRDESVMRNLHASDSGADGGDGATPATERDAGPSEIASGADAATGLDAALDAAMGLDAAFDAGLADVGAALEASGANDASALEALTDTSPDTDASQDAALDAAQDAAIDSGPAPFSSEFRVAAGANDSCALLRDGSFKCWGDEVSMLAGHGAAANTMGPNLPVRSLGAGVRVARIALGQGARCAIASDASLRCWGYNTYGEAGGTGPVYLDSNARTVDLGAGRTALDVASAWAHSCALLDDHSVKCFGYNEQGQLGQGNVMNSNLPLSVPLGTGRTAKAIDADGYFSCAVLDDDSLKCWGSNGNSSTDVSLAGGNLGTGDTRARGNNADEMGDFLLPVDVGTNPSTNARYKVKRVRLGSIRTCALLENDRLKCFGRNDGVPDYLGTGDTTMYGSAPGVLGDSIPFIELGTDPGTSQPWKVLDFDVGDSMSCALLTNERIKCWGSGSLGSLGTGVSSGLTAVGNKAGDMGDALPFVDLGTNPNTGAPWKVRQVACGKYHSCVLLEGDVVKCWGYNSAGQLGLEDQKNRGDMPGQMGDNLPQVKLF